MPGCSSRRAALGDPARRRDLRRNDMDHEKHIRDLEFKHAAMITAMREQFDRKAKELQKEYQDKMHHLRGACRCSCASQGARQACCAFRVRSQRLPHVTCRGDGSQEEGGDA